MNRRKGPDRNPSAVRREKPITFKPAREVREKLDRLVGVREDENRTAVLIELIESEYERRFAHQPARVETPAALRRPLRTLGIVVPFAAGLVGVTPAGNGADSSAARRCPGAERTHDAVEHRGVSFVRGRGALRPSASSGPPTPQRTSLLIAR